MPIEAVALKLFTGIESFEIMAIPFFILAGNFLTHGGVARRMIAFATSMVGHWYGGLGLAGVMACALFAAISGSSPATVVAIGSIILPAMVQQGFSQALRRRRDRDLGRARHSHSAVDRDGDAMRWRPAAASRSIRKASACCRPRSAQLFMAGVVPGLILATMLGMTTFYRAWKNDYPRMPKATWAEALRAFRRFDLGPAADRDRARRHLHRRLHADRSRRHERGLCLRDRGVRLSRHEADATCRRCCSARPT